MLVTLYRSNRSIKFSRPQNTIGRCWKTRSIFSLRL